MNPESLLVGAYTHLNYAFAFINPTSYKIANMQDEDDDYMPRLTALKNYNPGLEVWVSYRGKHPHLSQSLTAFFSDRNRRMEHERPRPAYQENILRAGSIKEPSRYLLPILVVHDGQVRI